MGRTERSDGGPAGDRALPADVAALVEAADHRKRGFFGPDSIMWTVNREKVLLLSGVSTILLQIAHPLVAAGVADHSRFATDPSGRFRRTFDLVHAILFGDVDTAVGAALTLRTLHGQVSGTLEEDVGPFTAGEHYTAADPDLLLWVHATLIEQSLTAYDTYVTPLPATAREAYYRESKRFGRLLGIPASRYPDTLADFETYYERMLTEVLTVGAQGKALQRTLFAHGRALRPLYAFVGAGTLPASARAAFGLPWSPRRQRTFDAGAALVKRGLPTLPARLRYVTAYRRARRRLQRLDDAP